jgi:formylmethanofuran dehydrogenase subunit E
MSQFCVPVAVARSNRHRSEADMKPLFRKHIVERKAAFAAYFVANPDAQLCDQCIRKNLKCQRSTFPEKDIRDSAVEAGPIRKFALCSECGENVVVTSPA